MHFFKKYARIKIEEHKILVLMDEHSRNQDKKLLEISIKYKWIIS